MACYLSIALSVKGGGDPFASSTLLSTFTFQIQLGLTHLFLPGLSCLSRFVNLHLHAHLCVWHVQTNTRLSLLWMRICKQPIYKTVPCISHFSPHHNNKAQCISLGLYGIDQNKAENSLVWKIVCTLYDFIYLFLNIFLTLTCFKSSNKFKY